MAKFSLRRVENQAQLSLITSVLSLLTLGGLAAMLGFFLQRGLKAGEVVLYYGPRAKLPVLAVGAVTLLLAAAGFGLGLSSAGQRRNEKQALSWIGFFIGAVVLALTFVIIFLFMQRGEPVIR